MRIYALMVLAAVCWAGAFIAGKFAVPYIPTCTLTFGRFLLASIVLHFVKRYMDDRHPEEAYRFQKEDLPKFLFTGIIGMVGYHVLFFLALDYTTAINSSIIGATNPIVTTALTIIFLKQKVPAKQLVGIILSLTGVVLTITACDLSVLTSFSFNKGDLLMCAAVVFWAAYGVYSKAKCSHITPIAITYYSFAVCAVTMVPFVIWENPLSWIGSTPASAYIAILFMAVFSSCFAYLVQQIAIKEIGPARTSVFINLVPVFSSLMAVAVLGETLQPIKIFTALLIIIGVCICQLAGTRGAK